MVFPVVFSLPSGCYRWYRWVGHGGGGQSTPSQAVMHHVEVETLTPCDAALSDPSSSQVCLPKSMFILLAQMPCIDAVTV